SKTVVIFACATVSGARPSFRWAEPYEDRRRLAFCGRSIMPAPRPLRKHRLDLSPWGLHLSHCGEGVIMARVFITGSSDGLGQMAAQLLIEQGHNVVLHARSEQRSRQARAAVPGAEGVVIGDLASIAE